MQNVKFQKDEIPDEELIDTLIAISVVAKRLATKYRKIKEKGDRQNESHRRNFTTARKHHRM